MRKWILAAVAALVVFGAGVSTVIILSHKNNLVPAANNEPISFAGAWHANVNEAQFLATITGDGIEIQLRLGDDQEGLYWKGSFPATTDGDATILSQGDVDAMSESMYGSQDASKVFVYKDGKITFKMTIAGVTTNVHLER